MKFHIKNYNACKQLFQGRCVALKNGKRFSVFEFLVYFDGCKKMP